MPMGQNWHSHVWWEQATCARRCCSRSSAYHTVRTILILQDLPEPSQLPGCCDYNQGGCYSVAWDAQIPLKMPWYQLQRGELSSSCQPLRSRTPGALQASDPPGIAALCGCSAEHTMLLLESVKSLALRVRDQNWMPVWAGRHNKPVVLMEHQKRLQRKNGHSVGAELCNWSCFHLRKTTKNV